MGRALKYARLKKSSRSARIRRELFWGRRRAQGSLDWKLCAVRHVGTSHLSSRVPCQDQADARRFSNGVVAAALSDGAGSSAYSHYGAYLVIQKALELVWVHFSEAFGSQEAKALFVRRFIAVLQKDLSELADLGINLTGEEREKNSEPSREDVLLVPCELKELACTLLLAAVKKGRFLVLHVGDGVVGAEYEICGRSKLAVLSHPDNGEFANETCFVTSASAADKARLITGTLGGGYKRLKGFILMSDGPEAALYDKAKGTLAPACRKLFGAVRACEREEVQSKLETTIESVIQKKTADDCSIAIIACEEGGPL